MRSWRGKVGGSSLGLLSVGWGWGVCVLSLFSACVLCAVITENSVSIAVGVIGGGLMVVVGVMFGYRTSQVDTVKTAFFYGCVLHTCTLLRLLTESQK